MSDILTRLHTCNRCGLRFIRRRTEHRCAPCFSALYGLGMSPSMERQVDLQRAVTELEARLEKARHE